MTERDQPRTKERAEAVVLSHVQDALDSIEDESAKGAFSTVLLIDVFNLAWLHQFDADRGDFRLAARRAVENAIEASEVGEASNAD